MRLQGRIESWNDQRGFGFVIQNATEKKAFVHISAFADRRRRPVAGALVTYEEGKDERGRPKAVEVRYVDRAPARERKPASALGFILVGVFAVAVVAAVVFVSVTQPSRQDLLRAHPEFQCEPKKTYCSEMKSCDEAKFHQKVCGGTKMDGDYDGIPCEDQWCN